MEEPVIAGKQPIAVDVVAGKNYFWCACGKSATQPFCDGAHKGSGFAPVPYKAEADRKVFFCACKKTSKAPMCDGTHSKL
ncbi:MAG: CDGSH iron-sulfur domain-containing protein [Alphaproteobacteria bacterium]|nr:CDGSH iron-sulfur domain-containing protein [Alphaproteobacteria bacterium]